MHLLSRDQKGFTLIEVLIVLAVIGIITAIAIQPLMSMRDKSKIRADVREIVSVFVFAQSEAVKRNRGVAILFDSPTVGSYSVFVDDGTGVGGIANDAVQQAGELTFLTKTLQAGVSFDVAGSSFTVNNPGYDFRGLPQNEVFGSIDIISVGLPQLQYRINFSLSGQVGIQVSENGGTTWQ